MQKRIGFSVRILCITVIILSLSGSVVLAGILKVSEGFVNPFGGFEKIYYLDGDPQAAIAGVEIPDTIKPVLTAKYDGIKHLRLFFFNDLHGHLTIPHQTRGDTHYFAQMVKRVSEARKVTKTNEAVLFFSAGDDHIGSIFDELYGYSLTTFVADPAYRAYSAGGVDAVVLGNHEFDRGTLLLSHSLRYEALFPVLSANVHSSRYLKAGQYHPAVIGIARGMRIGLIGLTTPRDTHTHEKDDPTFAVASPLATLKNLLPHVAELSDIVIILSHVGYEETRSNFAGEGDADLALLARKMTNKPVLIVGGHSHSVLNKDKLETVPAGVPVFQAGNRGQYIGEAIVTLNAQGMTVESARLYPLKKRDNRIKPDHPKYHTFEQDVDYDRYFEAQVIAPLLDKLSVKLGESIATVADIPGLTTEKVVSERYIGECLIANFMNDAIVARSAEFTQTNGRKVDLALINSSGINSGIPTGGKLTFNDWYQVMPFADTVQIGSLTGRQIKEMVINNAKRVVRPNELTGPTPLNLSGYFARGFLHFSGGLRYTIKLGSNADETTAVNITLYGKPIDSVLDQTFLVAFNSFVGDGAYNESWNGNPIGAGISGKVTGFNIKVIPKTDTGLIYRNEIIAFIRDQGKIDATTGARLDGRVTVEP